MAFFKYSALTDSDRLMTGRIEAADHEQAKEQLEEMKLRVEEIELEPLKKEKGMAGKGDFHVFNEQLASIARAGIPLEKGLRRMAEDMSSSKMKRLVSEIADELEKGVDIIEAVGKKREHFPPLYTYVLKAGVETGRLADVLTTLNRHLERSGYTRRILFETAAYPLTVMLIAALIATFLFIFVIPTFEDVLFDMSGGSAGLPALTRMVFVMSDHVLDFWIVTGAVIGLIIFSITALSWSREGRVFKESVLLKTPLFGRLHLNSVMTRFCEVMAILVSTGSGLATALRVSAEASGSDKLSGEIQKTADKLEEGNSFYEASQFSGMPGALFSYSVQLGAQRNDLEATIGSLADMYSNQMVISQNRLRGILVPGMIIFLGLFISLIVLALFLPMVKMVTVLM